ncbi:MAG: translational GTPase TypA [Maricaulis sp.]|uniref:translational GTPase TypA n=1 Tax=Maricaulis sp. TaxID=1486257 RepID=UPI001B17295F|nr:translational GTPase TypA [Maricaulis sp.]MBO6730526.1 translational GTPase TypA [Maricaulis sp.]MBO6846781.1 translational GTPase TypA [Maricaulis sp.]MBO6877537.1 translational GTPase TypA [Maricaulis sp.]MDM7984653.1 translational GTPase TypA [Maricaulis sp.]
MSASLDKLRNIAIVAHVDHGKTTLVDQLLKQSGTLDERAATPDRVMDSNDLEKERGITILAKNTAVTWGDWSINIVDTPGHADFGGEVERVLSMVDGVLLLVDAVDGPMPQTSFVTKKALARGLKPIVVINKADRPSARPDWVVDQTFDLFDRLGANEEQLDFPVVYASALQGWAANEAGEIGTDMTPLFEMITKHTPKPELDLDGPLQLQVSALDYSSFTGVIGIGRVHRGKVGKNQPVVVAKPDGREVKGRVLQVFGFHGLERVERDEAQAGDIITFTGIEDLKISDTVCDPEHVEALPPLSVDEPTLSMTFQVNDSPFAGREGKYVTSRNIKDRLERELIHNVALKVEQQDDPDKFTVSGRGELHLSILIETMRREGYELAVGRPRVVLKEIDGEICEPYESLTIDMEEEHQGGVMEKLGTRKAELKNMVPDGHGRVRIDYVIPTRGLIGFRSEFLTLTSGTGLMFHTFDHYAPKTDGVIGQRHNGAMVSMVDGKVLGFALFNLQERGKLFLGHGVDIYEGMLIGVNAREEDMIVNPTKGKKLTNMRASGTDENIVLTPPIKVTLEYALEFIDDDELVEVTPESIRIRKIFLKEHERKKEKRQAG